MQELEKVPTNTPEGKRTFTLMRLKEAEPTICFVSENILRHRP